MKNNDSEFLYQIALSQIKGVGNKIAKNLVNGFGRASNVFNASQKELSSIKGISSILAKEILNKKVLIDAEKEIEFILKNKIDVYFFNDEDYPCRLKECSDPPILLYYKGNTALNALKILSIVGTRKSSDYGNSFCMNFLEEISSCIPDLLIVSGLAYGIDINAHRAALKHKLPTVAILAHGLDKIYPSNHRNTAIDMLENGGLLTEFGSGTSPDKFNFVRRNRIIAGLSDATIVVESSLKGGSLITADIANSYNREVFAVPGRITDKESAGCNMLIEENKAILLQSTDNLLKHLNWDTVNTNTAHTKQHELLFDLSVEEQAIHDLLIAIKEPIHINFFVSELDQSISNLQSILLTMEMKNVIKSSPGGYYTLIQY